MIKKLSLMFFFLLGFVVVLLSFYDSKFAFYQFKADYAKASWIYKNIVKKPQNIDFAFVGSSHIFTNINDSLLFELDDKKHSFCNLGIAGQGRNMQYKILKSVLDSCKIKTLYLEVRDAETRIGHFGYSILAKTNELIEMPLNIKYFSDWLMALKYRRNYVQHLIYPDEKLKSHWENRSDGHLRYKRFPSKLALEKQTKDFHANRMGNLLGEKNKALEFRLAIFYLKKIIDLAKKNQVEIKFLFLPPYKGNSQPDNAFDYRKFGTIVNYPKHIFEKAENWADPAHLNPKGAMEYTKWLWENELNNKLTTKKP